MYKKGEIKMKITKRELSELIKESVQRHIQMLVEENEQDNVTIVYEDSEWKVLIPHTEESSILYANGAKWDTAQKNSMFVTYNRVGSIYMAINKKDKKKSLQWHYGGNNFGFTMTNYDDHRIEIEEAPKIIQTLIQKYKK